VAQRCCNGQFPPRRPPTKRYFSRCGVLKQPSGVLASCGTGTIAHRNSQRGWDRAEGGHLVRADSAFASNVRKRLRSMRLCIEDHESFPLGGSWGKDCELGVECRCTATRSAWRYRRLVGLSVRRGPVKFRKSFEGSILFSMHCHRPSDAHAKAGHHPLQEKFPSNIFSSVQLPKAKKKKTVRPFDRHVLYIDITGSFFRNRVRVSEEPG
jgi:hypothetical protein